MAEMQMTYTDQDSIVAILHTLRRSIRAIERVLFKVDDDDIQRKFKQFLNEHETFSDNLKAHIEDGFASSDTPETIIQFPISTSDLLAIVAKSEKQIIDEIDSNLTEDLPQRLITELKSMRQKIMKSYDYIEALADIWG